MPTSGSEQQAVATMQIAELIERAATGRAPESTSEFAMFIEASRLRFCGQLGPISCPENLGSRSQKFGNGRKVFQGFGTLEKRIVL